MGARERGPHHDASFSRTMTRVAVAIVGAGLLALAGVVLVAANPPAPTVIGERYDSAGLVAPAGPGVLEPSVRWIEDGRRLLVTTYGSSSCPEAPTAAEVEGVGLRIDMVTTGGPACTDDLGPTSYAMPVPAELRGEEHLDVVLRREGEPPLDLVVGPVAGGWVDAEIATYVSTGFSDAALIGGVLVSQDGCLYIEHRGRHGAATTRTLPIFPEQTTSWDGLTLVTGDESHALGESVSFGGGMVAEPTSPRDLSGRPGMPDACDATRAFAVAPSW